MEAKREELVHAYATEKDEIITREEQELEELHNEILALQRERDESLLLAENDKQQVRVTALLSN